ncbi:MAG: hypothetical protein C4543_01040 [Ignavibacteriales bacterium]|nr:MAG: hypothetical protein C4543_01040 [Ignavibacteriales bacterium]
MKNLFKSQTSYEILDLFTKNGDKSFYMTQLSKELAKDPANITRELDKLVRDNIVNSKTVKGKKYYSLNKEYKSHQELVNLFEKNRIADFKDKFETEWLLGEDIPNMCPFFCQIWTNCFVDEFANPSGKAYKKVVSIFKDYHLWFYFDKQDAYEVGQNLVDKFVDNPKFMEEVNKNIEKWSDKLVSYCEKLPSDNLNKLSNKKLWELYKAHEDIHTDYYRYGWIPVAADMFHNNLTEKGKEILKNLGVRENDMAETLMTLTEPTRPSLIKMEEDEIKELAAKVQANSKQLKLFKTLFKKFKEEDVKLFGLYTHSPEYEAKFEEKVRELIDKIEPNIVKVLEKHYEKYFYTKFLFTEEQGVYNFEHYLKKLVKLVNNDPNVAKTIKEENEEIKNLIKKRDSIIKQLKLSAKYKIFFDQWGEFMITKIYRRYAQLFALYRMVPIVEEIGNRLGLSIKETKFMTTEEIYNALFKNQINKDEIKKRIEFTVHYTDKNEHMFYIGSQAKQAAELIQTEKIEAVSEIKGQCGCRGHAKGVVRIVNVIEDMQKMKEGDVLVSIATQPDLLPAMKKASAFVTDQGGVTSHAAIVAREMKTPCVIATKIATKVLRDGDLVEVDADKGIVKIIK